MFKKSERLFDWGQSANPDENQGPRWITSGTSKLTPHSNQQSQVALPKSLVPKLVLTHQGQIGTHAPKILL